MTEIEFDLTGDARDLQTELSKDIAALDAWNAKHPTPQPVNCDQASPWKFVGVDEDGLATYRVR